MLYLREGVHSWTERYSQMHTINKKSIYFRTLFKNDKSILWGYHKPYCHNDNLKMY